MFITGFLFGLGFGLAGLVITLPFAILKAFFGIKK